MFVRAIYIQIFKFLYLQRKLSEVSPSLADQLKNLCTAITVDSILQKRLTCLSYTAFFEILWNIHNMICTVTMQLA